MLYMYKLNILKVREIYKKVFNNCTNLDTCEWALDCIQVFSLSTIPPFQFILSLFYFACIFHAIVINFSQFCEILFILYES